VILDADLARLYGVTTKRLNQQVSRNRNRFPDDFMFQLTSEEKTEVVANCDHLSKLKFSPVLPYVVPDNVDFCIVCYGFKSDMGNLQAVA
jgi:hypothetical protein